MQKQARGDIVMSKIGAMVEIERIYDYVPNNLEIEGEVYQKFEKHRR
jgi:hypothetical protein